MGFNVAAAFGLLVAVAAVTIGTIVQSAHATPVCGSHCSVEAHRTTSAAEAKHTWQSQIDDALCRTQNGFMLLAGRSGCDC